MNQTRDLVLMSLFAAVIAALGLMPKVPLGFGVPITAQSLGVMLAGSILGARRAAGAITIFVVLVALGMPLLAGGRGGLGVLAGPSGGFVVGYIFGAFVTGLIAERLTRVPPVARFLTASVIGGIGVVYLAGVAYWALISSIPLGRVLLLTLAFLPGDLAKACVATLVASAVYRGYPMLGRA